MTRKLSLFAMVLAIFFVLIFARSPLSARAQSAEWEKVTILPETGHWNFPDYFLVTAHEDVVLSWEIKCTEGGCFGRQPDFVNDFPLAAGETVRIGWGPQCYRWQFDPVDWHGYIAEPYPEVCAALTATPTDTVPEETPTATPTDIIDTPTTTPETPTPGTATPTVTGTIVTTPPAITATASSTPEPTEPPSQPPAETPRSQLIAVTGADLNEDNDSLPRLLVSLGIVFLGLGVVGLGISRKWKRE